MPDLASAFRGNGQNWFFSSVCPFPPIRHPFPCAIELASQDRLALVANAVDRDDSPILHEKPQHASIELANAAQFKKSAAERLVHRLPVILPVPQFCQTGDHAAKSSGSFAFNSSRNSRTGHFPASVS